MRARRSRSPGPTIRSCWRSARSMALSLTSPWRASGTKKPESSDRLMRRKGSRCWRAGENSRRRTKLRASLRISNPPERVKFDVSSNHEGNIMRISRPATGSVLACLLLLLFALPLQLAQAQRAGNSHVQAQRGANSYEEKKRQTNDIAVTIVTSGLTCTCARFAEDMRNVVNDLRPDGLRVLPVLGVGGLQNVNDVLFMKGIDMGVVDEDNLRLLKKRDPQLYANLEQRIQYITKLYNSEFHVVARNEIATYEDLRGKKVSFNLKDSQTEVTADIIFNALKIDVQRVNYDNDEAIKKLREGEIAAMIV